MKIYHYTTFATFLDYILPTGKLKFGDFLNANDPREFVRSVKWQSGCCDNLSKKKCDAMNEIYFDTLHKYQYISCCIDKKDIFGYNIPSMWAHYGEGHQGICIEIDTDKIDENDILFQQEISYVNFKPIEGYYTKSSDKTLERDINTYITQNKDMLFFSKFPCWEYEQEYRLIKLNKPVKPIYIDISNAITAVYCGTKMNNIRYNIIYLLTAKSYKLATREGVLHKTEHPYDLLSSENANINKATIRALRHIGIDFSPRSTTSKKEYFKKIIPRFDQIFETNEK